MSAKPEAGEAVLRDNHSDAYHHGIGDAQLVIAGKAVAAEDGTADDRLQQIIGETHAAEDAQVTEHTADTLKGIPCRDHSRDNHQENNKIVDGLEPHLDSAKVHKTQGNDNGGRQHEDSMPDLKVAPFVVEHSLAP